MAKKKEQPKTVTSGDINPKSLRNAEPGGVVTMNDVEKLRNKPGNPLRHMERKPRKEAHAVTMEDVEKLQGKDNPSIVPDADGVIREGAKS